VTATTIHAQTKPSPRSPQQPVVRDVAPRSDAHAGAQEESALREAKKALQTTLR
jgi:hypothetical protein